jgi:hypothetical protein
MNDYHEVTCPICNMRVEAEWVRSSLTKHFYLCPNEDHHGRTHSFSVTKTAVKVAKTAFYGASILSGFFIGDVD